MAISARLQQRYSSEVDVDWWEALIISHSQFPQMIYLTSNVDQQQGIVDGALQTFEPIPFSIKMPNRNQEGRSDMQLAIGAIGTDITSMLESAILVPTERIRVRYTVYILGDTAPQYDPMLDFSLTNIALSETQVTANASQTDTINAVFPSKVYRGSEFPGLVRR